MLWKSSKNFAAAVVRMHDFSTFFITEGPVRGGGRILAETSGGLGGLLDVLYA